MNETSNSVGNIITLIVGVGIAVLVLIFVGSLGGQTFQLVEPNLDAIGQTAFNQNFTPHNGTVTTLTNSVYSSFVARNYSNGVLVGSGNYTVSGTSFNLSNNLYNHTNLNVSYIYTNGTVTTSIRNSIVSGFSALETTGDYLPMIVLAVIIVLILSIVIGSTLIGGRNRGEGNAL